LVAFLIAFLSESIKLHDKVSDLLRIRSEFDTRWILIPMALLSSATLTSAQFEKLRAERGRLMDDVFYAYASGSAKRQMIDDHAITQALTAWSWYWLCVEAIAVVIPTAAILAFSGQSFWVESLLAIVLSLMLMMRVFRADCAKYADSQVRQILNDISRRTAVAATFNAL
jgi:hypothetical protein